MSDPQPPERGDDERAEPPAVPAAPALPEVDSPPPEAVLEGVPSTEELVERAQPAEDVLAEQPSVDELLGRDRDRDRGHNPD